MVKKLNSEVREAQQKKGENGQKKLFDQNIFGKNLRIARDGHYSQKELAEEAKEYGNVALSLSTIKACERGEGNISAQALFVLSDIFNQSMDDFVGRNFKIADSKEAIRKRIGLSEKSINYLCNKLRNKRKIPSRVPSLNEKSFNLTEIDIINYFIEYSDFFTIFLKNAKRVHTEIYEFNKEIDLKNEARTNSKDEKEKRLLSKELKTLKQKKEDTINSQIFSMYNSINKDFRRFITYLYQKNK